VKANVATTTYSDMGADAPGTETPLQLGTTGPWKDAGQSLGHARLNTAAVIAPDPGGAARYVYVVGGFGQCGAGAAAIMGATNTPPLRTTDPHSAHLQPSPQGRQTHACDTASP
jgi:hypothetical protein